MQVIDIVFPLQGTVLPANHGYELYSALSRVVPFLHQPDCPILVAPISGQFMGNSQLQLAPRRSWLRLRLPTDHITTVLSLTGQTLDLAGQKVRLGVPQVQALMAVPSLQARLVTIKKFTEPGPFLEACQRQLHELGIGGEVGIPLRNTGKHAGQPRRGLLIIKETRVIGFPVQVHGLTAAESLLLQEQGLGGRKKMGCGFFVPLLPREGRP